jgi:hypothetical protein
LYTPTSRRIFVASRSSAMYPRLRTKSEPTSRSEDQVTVRQSQHIAWVTVLGDAQVVRGGVERDVAAVGTERRRAAAYRSPACRIWHSPSRSARSRHSWHRWPAWSWTSSGLARRRLRRCRWHRRPPDCSRTNRTRRNCRRAGDRWPASELSLRPLASPPAVSTLTLVVVPALTSRARSNRRLRVEIAHEHIFHLRCRLRTRDRSPVTQRRRDGRRH